MSCCAHKLRILNVCLVNNGTERQLCVLEVESEEGVDWGSATQLHKATPTTSIHQKNTPAAAHGSILFFWCTPPTGGATTTGPDATYPPAICQNWGGGQSWGSLAGGRGRACRGSGGGLAGGEGGVGWGEGGGLGLGLRLRLGLGLVLGLGLALLRRPIVPPIVFSKKNSCPTQSLASLLHSQA